MGTHLKMVCNRLRFVRERETSLAAFLLHFCMLAPYFSYRTNHVILQHLMLKIVCVMLLWHEMYLRVAASWPKSCNNELWMHLLLSRQHHRVAVQTVDIIVVSPCLLGIHTQGLAIHHLIQDLWRKEKMKGVKWWSSGTKWIQSTASSEGKTGRKKEWARLWSTLQEEAGAVRKWEAEKWKKRMTKEKCNKKVASGEPAFSCYDPSIWDQLE